jgi:hypothetical protein
MFTENNGTITLRLSQNVVLTITTNAAGEYVPNIYFSIEGHTSVFALGHYATLAEAKSRSLSYAYGN